MNNETKTNHTPTTEERLAILERKVDEQAIIIEGISKEIITVMSSLREQNAEYSNEVAERINVLIEGVEKLHGIKK